MTISAKLWRHGHYAPPTGYPPPTSPWSGGGIRDSGPTEPGRLPVVQSAPTIPLPTGRGIVLQTHYEIRTSLPVVLFRRAIAGAAISGHAGAGSLCRGAGLRIGVAGRAALHFRPLDPVGAPVVPRGGGREDQNAAARYRHHIIAAVPSNPHGRRDCDARRAQ